MAWLIPGVSQFYQNVEILSGAGFLFFLFVFNKCGHHISSKTKTCKSIYHRTDLGVYRERRTKPQILTSVFTPRIRVLRDDFHPMIFIFPEKR